MLKTPRLTENVAAIFAVLLASQRPWYGLELAKAADIGSATVYAALSRLEEAGLVRGTWEAVDPKAAGRPRRRLYTLTGEGVDVARNVVSNYTPRARRLPVGWGAGPAVTAQ